MTQQLTISVQLVSPKTEDSSACYETSDIRGFSIVIDIAHRISIMQLLAVLWTDDFKKWQVADGCRQAQTKMVGALCGSFQQWTATA